MTTNTKYIKDFLHLYGIDVEGVFDNKKWSVLQLKKTTVRLTRIKADGYPEWNECHYSEFKPFLRKLADMTEEDVKMLDEYVFHIKDRNKKVFKHALEEYREVLLDPWPIVARPAFPVYVRIINKLRNIGFDCDGLIDAGIALEKSKLK